MTITNRLGRPMIAAMFISGGADQLRNPESKAEVAADLAGEINERTDDVPLPEDPVDMVRINGAVQVVAGSLLVLNRLPRLASLALAGSLVPTTLGAHRFWEIEDDDARAQQRVHFLKNLAMFGGLLIAAGDTGRRPSVGWRAGRAVTSTGESVRSTGDDVSRSARRFRRSTAAKAGAVAGTAAGTIGEVKGKVAGAGRSSTPALHDATDAAAEAASAAYDRAQPAVAAASKKTQARAKALWAAAVPVAETVRDHAADLADQAGDVAVRARKASRRAVDTGGSKLRSVTA